MRFLYMTLLISLAVPAFSQTANSVQNGDWNNTATWDCACVPDFNSAGITISAFTTVTIPAGYTADADQVLVDGDGVLTIQNTGRLIIRDGTGDDLSVNVGDGFFTFDGILNVNSGAVLENRGQISSASSNVLISGTFQHSLNGGTIPNATWDTGSTLEVTGLTSSKPSGLGQTFYNVVWNSTQMGAISLLGELQNISNDFTVTNTGAKPLVLTTSTNSSLNVGGDLTIENSSVLGLTQSSTFTLTISGHLTVNSSSTNSLLFTATGSATINVSGNFTKLNSGSVNFASSTGGTGNLNVSGNFSVTAGTLTETSSGSGNIVFNRAGVQNFVGGGSIENTVNYTVNSGATLDLDTYALTGAGTFTLNGILNVGSTDPSGAIQTGISAGNLRVGTRIFASGSRINYDGASAQFIGTGHPTDAGVVTRIANASGVSLVSNATIGGDLVLVDGNLNVGAYTLTLNANVNPNTHFIVVEAASSLIVNGSGNLGTFPFPAGVHTLTNFTLNRSSGSVTFGNDVTLTGALTLTNGNLVFNNQTLTLNGTFSASSGALSANTSSTLSIGGDGAFGTLAFASTGNTVNTLTFNRGTSGTGSINSTLTVTNALNLSNGDLTNTSGLTLDNGATLTRNSAAQLLGSSPTVAAGEFYNVIYTGGALTSGLELPNTADDDLMNLTVNGGPVTLGKNIIVNGTLTLQNSTLDAGGFNITMAGNPGVWDRQAGSFTPGTGAVIISGNITLQGTQTPRFGNLIVNSGATLSLPSLVNIDGNLQIDASSTFNHNNGTVRFSGATTQALAGAGKTFNNLTVNKSGGALQMSSAVNLLGILSVETATEVQSNGSLTLISTSDGTSGNASIAPLASGASITGNVTAQRYMSSEGRIYRYISSPVSGAPVSALQDDFPVTGTFSGASTCSGCTTNASMFYYNETVAGVADNGYVAFPSAFNTETLTVGRGYAPFIRQDIIGSPVTIDVTGTVNQGNVILPVTYTNTGDATADGYNLVGNPYPSTIDWDIIAGWSKTSINNSIAVRDNGSGGVYQYWNGETGGLANGLIAAGQGFWVQANGASPALEINEQAKTTSTGTFFRMRTQEVDVVELLISNGKITDRAFFHLSKDSRDGSDPMDARKLNNASFDFSILSKEGINLAIHATNRIPTRNESIRLRIKDMVKGAYSFSLNKLGQFSGYDYFLLDRFTNKSIDLQETPVYAFSVTSAVASYAPDRFELFMFRSLDGKNARAEFEEETADPLVQIFPNPSVGRVYIRSTTESLKSVGVLNSVGLLVESITMVNINNEHWEGYTDLTDMPNGIYFVRVIDSEGKISTTKVFKK